MSLIRVISSPLGDLANIIKRDWRAKINMICPFCNNEMTKGKLLGNVIKIKWIPDGPDVPQTGLSHVNGEVELKNESRFGRPYTEAYICRECNKLITCL
jgi:hypothetical protein